MVIPSCLHEEGEAAALAGAWGILAMPTLTWPISVCVRPLAIQLSLAPVTTREVGPARTQGHGKDTSIIPLSSVWVPVEWAATASGLARGSVCQGRAGQMKGRRGKAMKGTRGPS